MDETTDRIMRERTEAMLRPHIRYVIFGWLDGFSAMKRLAMDGDTVLIFDSEKAAYTYYVDFMTPDWEIEIVAMPTLSVATEDE
jgi:hypothetical protein